MANVNVSIEITTNDAATVKGLLTPTLFPPAFPPPQNTGGNSRYITKFTNFFGKLALGVWNSRIIVTTGQVAATGTVTLSSMVANDTVTINGTVLTAATTPSTTVQFKVGATDTATAANLATVINANLVLDGQVFATSAGAVVTLTCVHFGLLGNLCTLAISAHGSVSGAVMTGGSDSAVTGFGTSFISHGL